MVKTFLVAILSFIVSFTATAQTYKGKVVNEMVNRCVRLVWFCWQMVVALRLLSRVLRVTEVFLSVKTTMAVSVL